MADCQIIENLAEISDGYDAIFCDLWGCFHNGIEVYPAAVAACQGFRERGGTVILLTNAPRPEDSVERMLINRMGAPRDSWDAIVSSGGACQAALTGGQFGTRFLYVGPDRDLHMLQDVGLTPAAEDDAEAILITGLRDDMTEKPEDYAEEITRWASRGLPMLCANPDIVVDRGEERLWCAGAIARDYEIAGGNVTWYGKPHQPVYERCRAVLAEQRGQAIPDARILAIGDGIATDVPGGLAAGLDTLFVTGGLSGDLFGPDVEAPEPIALNTYLDEQNLSPQFGIGRLR
ncbi:MAG: TIGR01459 family HAD-type hydrolase [Pseudomonadota bacterium]